MQKIYAKYIASNVLKIIMMIEICASDSVQWNEFNKKNTTYCIEFD